VRESVKPVIPNPLDRPRLMLSLFVLACLLAFWATIPLPRADNQLVGSDGVNYYAYLPSLVLDGDLDFRDEFQALLAYSPEEIAARTAAYGDVDPVANPHGIGPALFWMPFFLLAHGLALLLNWAGFAVNLDGYGYFYQAIVLTGSILYGGLGLWFTYLFVRRLASQRSALTAVLLVAAAGNVVYYMTAEPSMSHNLSLMLSALFFLVWERYRDDNRLRIAALYGLIGGAMALVRQQDGLFLLLPYLAQIPAIWRGLRSGDMQPFLRTLRNGALAALVAFAVFSLQLAAWGVMYGNPFYSPYSSAGEFSWFRPWLGSVLFSARRGLFVWHPVFLFTLAGLAFTYRKDRTFAIWGSFGFALQLYLIGSWSWWWQGGSFGARMLIVCTPIFALGLAGLINYAAQRWSWRVVYVAGALLLAWNFLLFVEYRFWLVYAEVSQDTIPTWYDMTIGRVTFFLDRLPPIGR